jgi:hypothetical protein
MTDPTSDDLDLAVALAAATGKRYQWKVMEKEVELRSKKKQKTERNSGIEIHTHIAQGATGRISIGDVSQTTDGIGGTTIHKSPSPLPQEILVSSPTPSLVDESNAMDDFPVMSPRNLSSDYLTSDEDKNVVTPDSTNDSILRNKSGEHSRTESSGKKIFWKSDSIFIDCKIKPVDVGNVDETIENCNTFEKALQLL